MNKSILLFIFLFLINIIKGDNSELTLFVNPITGNNSTQCGLTTQNACQSIIYALNSFTASQTSSTNYTSLTLQLMDGIYEATNNSFINNPINITTLMINSYSNNNTNVILQSFNNQDPFLKYYDKLNINQTLSVNNITFVNSSFILFSNSSSLNVTFNGCIFRDLETNPKSLLTVSNNNVTMKPFLSILNSQFSNIVVGYGQPMVQTKVYTIILTNVSVINCSAYQIFSVNGNGDIFNFTMINSISQGSPMYLDIIDYVTITDSSFSNNTGSSGAIGFADEMSYRVVIENTNFTSNSGKSSGALNLALNNGGVYTISNCNFISNQCSNNGGAITSFSKHVTIEYSTFIGNTAINGGGAFYGKYPTSVIFNQCTLNNNNANTGGAISVSGSSLTLISDIFNSNNASDGNDIICSSSDITITPPNSIITSNFWCSDRDCTFNNPSFQCPASYDMSSSEKSNSSDSRAYPHKNGLDKKDITAIVVSVCVVGGIIIFIFMCICCRHRLHKKTHCTSGGKVIYHVDPDHDYRFERTPLIDNNHHHHNHHDNHHHGGHHHHH